MPFFTYSQSKEIRKVIGGEEIEECFSVLETRQHHRFLALGSTESFGAGAKDFLLIKADDEGTVLWAKTYGAKGNDYGRHLAALADGSYIMVGYTESFDPEFKEILAIKFDISGNMIWSKTYGLNKSDFASKVIPTADGGFVIQGEIINMIGHEKNQDILVFKCNKDGHMEWSRIFGGGKTEYGYSVQETSDKGFLISGETNSFGAGDWDFYVTKLNQTGEVQWSRTYGGKNIDYGRFGVELKDGGYMIGGNSLSFGTTGLDIIIVKLNEKGEQVWAKKYSGQHTDYMLEVKNTSDGYAMVGYTNSFGNQVEDAFLLMINNEGITKWSKTFGSKKNDYGVSMAVSDEFILAAGTTNSVGAGKDDILIIKTPLSWTKDNCSSNDINFATGNVTVSTSPAKTYEFDVHINEENIEIGVQQVDMGEQDLCKPGF
jgi:hypothetical protein